MTIIKFTFWGGVVWRHILYFNGTIGGNVKMEKEKSISKEELKKEAKEWWHKPLWVGIFLLIASLAVWMVKQNILSKHSDSNIKTKQTLQEKNEN